ncbi:unnamed protein product, partial [Wuchereria bancrofti]
MDGRTSPRLEEPINRNDKRNAVPKMMQNGDVKGDDSPYPFVPYSSLLCIPCHLTKLHMGEAREPYHGKTTDPR